MATPQSIAGFEPFIPEVWAAALMQPYQKATVFGQAGIINTNYVGEIAQKGDTVHVSAVGTPTIKSYDESKDIEVEDLNLTDTALTIDQGDYFAFRVGDVSALQAAGPVKDPALQQAAQGLAESVDTYIGKVMAEGAKNKLGTSEIAKRGDDAFDLLVEMRAKLNAESVPQLGRFVVIGQDFESALIRDDRFNRVDASGTDQTLRNGIIGRVLGFDVFVSPNVKTVAGRQTAVAGVADATTFAQQLTKIETARQELRFADLVKGLNVYGAKVFRPDALVSAEVTVKDTATAAPAGS